ETDTGLWKRYRTALTSWVIVTSIAQIMGYDYTAALLKNVALDPETKALKIKSQVTSIVGEIDHNDLVGVTANQHHAQVHTLNSHSVPTANVNLNSKKIINLLTPTLNYDAATKKYVDDNVNGNGAKALCFVRLTHNQSIPVDGYHVIEYDAEDVDIGGNFNTVTHRFTAPVSTYYQMAAQLWLDGQLTEKLWKFKIVVNNTYTNPNTMAGMGHAPLTSPGTDDSIRVWWTVKYLNVGDFVDTRVDQSSGSVQTVHGVESYPGHKTWMSIIQL
ncbi:unnamed protein product, partial [marine sediment metagenome]